MQNSDKKYREGESRKKNSMNVHLKMGGKKDLHSFASLVIK